MMRPTDVRRHLRLLNLAPAEAAELLGVGLRTVRRWTAPDEFGDSEPIPGAAEAALRAWLKLHRLGLSWRPGSSALALGDTGLAEAQEVNARALQAVLERVRARRGPATRWDVDLEHCRATLGKMVVSFYRRRNGSFAPQSFRRSDGVPVDLQRDQALLEDAYYCIHAKLQEQGDQPRVLLALGDPALYFGRHDLIEMWDDSLSPPVLVTVDLSALSDAIAAGGGDAQDLVRLVRTHKTALTMRAEALLAYGHVSVVEVLSGVGPAFRHIELDVNDLRAVGALAGPASAPLEHPAQGHA